MSTDAPREVPKEGSNHIEHENGQKRSNVSEAMSVQHRGGSPDRPSNDKDEPTDVEPADGDNRIIQPNTSDRTPQE